MYRVLMSVSFFCLLVFQSQAQNNMFLTLGVSQQEVSNILSTRDYISLMTVNPEDGTLTANRAGDMTEYKFYRDMLYCISMRKSYKNKKDAKSHIKNCIAYIESLGGEIGTWTKSNKFSISSEHDEYRHEFKVYQNGRNGVVLMMISTSLTFAPTHLNQQTTPQKPAALSAEHK